MQLREFTNSGMLLSGGKVYFYRAGSTTPLATYQDAQAAIENTNPVILDASGSAKIFLQAALYRVEIYSADDELIHEIDEIGSAAGASLGGTGSLAIVANYDAVRNLDKAYDAVLVLGRETASDGGQGLFLVSDSTADDDDGILLVRGSTTRYLRELNGYVDPLWYGVKYSNATDQRVYLLKAFTAGITYSLPVNITGDCYLGTNTTVPAGSRVIINGSLYGPGVSPPRITFADNAVLQSCSYAGIRLPLTLGVGCVSDTFNSSWLGGGDDAELARLASMSTEGYRVNIDKDYDIGASVSLPVNLTVDFIGGIITVDIGALNLQIANLVYQGKAQIINYTSRDYVNIFDLNQPVRPEWVGAVADGITDDSLAFFVACKSGNVLLDDKEYRLCTQTIVPDGTTITGNLPNALVYPNPLAASDIPTPKIKFGITGGMYKLDPLGTEFDNVIAFEIPDLDTSMIVSSIYKDAKYLGLTNPGYLYRIDLGTTNTAVKLTSTSRRWTQLWQYSDVLYGLVRESTFNCKIYRLNISGDTATETEVFSSTSYGISTICLDIGGTVYVTNSLGAVKTLDTVGWTLGATVASFSNTCRGLVGVDGILYGLVHNVGTGVDSIESMTVGGVVTSVVTLGYQSLSIAQFNHNIYLTSEIGNVLKITTGGSVSVQTTNATDITWQGISGGFDTLLVYSRSIGVGSGTLAVDGAISLANIALDGSDTVDKTTPLTTGNGTLGLTNCVSYYVYTDANVIANDSMIDSYLLLAASDSSLINCIKVDYTATDLKRYFYDNIAFKSAYFTSNKNIEPAYDSILVTDADGKVENKNELGIKTVSVDNLVLNTMLTVSQKVVTDLNYTVLDDDPVMLVFTATSNAIIVTLPATVPEGKTKFRIIARANDTAYYMSIAAANTWMSTNAGPVRIPPLVAGTFSGNKSMAFCYFVEGKWSVC